MTPSLETLPAFAIGQTAGVRDYVLSILPAMASRIGLDQHGAAEMRRLMVASLDAALDALPRFMEAPFTPSIPEGRVLFDWIGQHLVLPDSELVGAINVARALGLAASGANILVVGNHTSGADQTVMEHLINQTFGAGTTHSWRTMSGHIVNWYAIPLMLAGGLNRYQIVSVRYQGMCGGNQEEQLARMQRQNRAALLSLRRGVSGGGKIIMLYPEGGRGDHGLKHGEPRTMAIPQIMALSCERPLYILPCYIEDATSILPVQRDLAEREFTAVLCLARPGKATVRFGPPVSWCDFQPTEAQLDLGGTCDPESRTSAVNDYLIRQVMGQIASLCPNEAAKGPYAHQ